MKFLDSRYQLGIQMQKRDLFIQNIVLECENKMCLFLSPVNSFSLYC